MNPAELKAVVEYMESDRGVEREVIIRAIELALEGASERSGFEDDDTQQRYFLRARYINRIST